MDGTPRCFGGGYAETSGSSTLLDFPVEVVTAAKSGLAVTKRVRLGRSIISPGPMILGEVRTTADAVLKVIVYYLNLLNR